MRKLSVLFFVIVSLSILGGLAGLTKRSPLRHEKTKEFSETPPRRLVENLPPTDTLPSAANHAVHAPAFQTPAANFGPVWTALGPFPIPNGQTEGRVDPVSGRVTAIAINPADSRTVYVGTAQGGLYRTLNGGTRWTQLMDNAAPGSAGTPLAIGAVAIDPTNASNVLVGTGEGNLAGDSFFGSGLYIITNADSDTPTVNGPYNLRSVDGADIFTGRSIVSIAIDPADHNNVFCATSSGIGGLLPSTYSILPARGLYRTTNAFAGIGASGTPTFKRLNVEPTEGNSIITSVVIEPGNTSNLICALFSFDGNGGIYRSTNALVTNPGFTKTLSFPNEINAKLAINKGAESGELVTVYAATEEGSPNGRLYKSIDGGASFGAPLTAANGFAGSQGFYDIAIAVNPVNANKVYLGGDRSSHIFQYSNDGGQTFTSSVVGLHADTHAIAISASTPNVIYHGNDGGIWRSNDSGLNWISFNNSTFSATQFQDIAVHPSDRYFSIGGTQDNGTEFLMPDKTITRADFGDGGYSLIDQNAPDTTKVTMYHTYFNQSGLLIGTARVLNAPCATEGNWSFHGAFDGPLDGPFCDGSSDTRNGIGLSDGVNFYAPQALGPGNPNTWYFGSDKLYRSSNRADTATTASQLLDGGVPVSAIAISPQDDNVRIVALNNGKVYATTLGSVALLQIAGPGATNGTSTTPATGVSRIAIDPNNRSVAYLCFNSFGTAGNPLAHVWKTTNLTSPFVNFTPASKGLPDIPVNAIAIDAVTATNGSSADIYVGTDQAVYYSPDGGGSWLEYGRGFPRVAVFGLQIQSPSRVLRAATHGRGLYEAATVSTITPTPTPTPTPDPNADFSTKLRNVSTRGPVQSGDKAMIAGFIINGDAAKQVVIRGIGPSMTQRGVVDALQDPNISLVDSNGLPVASNDDYASASTADRTVLSANQLTPSDPRESAIVATLGPGAYTVILRGKANGVGLVEVYDVTGSAPAKLANISTRGKVEGDDNSIMIAGFILGTSNNQPGAARRVLIRVNGPTLKDAGLSDALADPTLEIYRGSQKIFENDNWQTQTGAGVASEAEIEASGLKPGNAKEPAIMITLEAGNYSAVVRGKNKTTGVALVEVYQLN